MPNTPVVILVRPQMGENIGAVARAMSNFGLSELRLVAPRDGWPNPKAEAMAAGGESIIANTQIYPTFVEAMHDIQLAYATTARPRDMEKRVVSASDAIAEIRSVFAKCALVFGPERSGLENDEIVRCHSIITLDTAPENRSLNLAQCAVILGYEWLKGSVECEVSSVEKSAILHTQNSALATQSEWQGLFTQLETYLDKAQYFRTIEKKPGMWQNVQTMLLRGQWTSQEVRSMRGMLRTLVEGKYHE